MAPRLRTWVTVACITTGHDDVATQSCAGLQATSAKSAANISGLARVPGRLAAKPETRSAGTRPRVPDSLDMPDVRCGAMIPVLEEAEIVDVPGGDDPCDMYLLTSIGGKSMHHILLST